MIKKIQRNWWDTTFIALILITLPSVISKWHGFPTLKEWMQPFDSLGHIFPEPYNTIFWCGMVFLGIIIASIDVF